MMQDPSESNDDFSASAESRKNLFGAGGCVALDHIPHNGHNPLQKCKVIDVEWDGSKTLLEQQTAINYAEQTKNLQLVCYQKGVAPKNFASVKQMPSGQTILPLLLLELPASTSVGCEVARQLAAGRHLVFYSSVYVKRLETKVAGFR